MAGDLEFRWNDNRGYEDGCCDRPTLEYPLPSYEAHCRAPSCALLNAMGVDRAMNHDVAPDGIDCSFIILYSLLQTNVKTSSSWRVPRLDSRECAKVHQEKTSKASDHGTSTWPCLTPAAWSHDFVSFADAPPRLDLLILSHS